MIKHVVLAKLKEYTPENLKTQMDLMLSLKDHIPTIKEHAVYADMMRTPVSFDIIAVTTFETRADLDAYIVHPYHADFIQKESEKLVAEIRLADYEI